MTFNDKAIIVTGAASGIGRDTALGLAASGARLVCSDINEAMLGDVVDEIIDKGGEARGIRVDVSIESDVQAMVGLCRELYGRLDGAANIAGRPSLSLQLHELTREQWDASLAVNLTGPFLCMKHQIPLMLESGGGSIVVVSSTAAYRAYPGISEYASGKAGVLGLVRSAALEYGPQGIRVNTVLPGTTDTPMMRAHMEKWPDIEDDVKAQHLLRRYGQPMEVARAIAWLLSDEASFVTAVALPVDGGQTAS